MFRWSQVFHASTLLCVAILSFLFLAPCAQAAVPRAPSHVSVRLSSSGVVTLRWRDESRNETRFDVQRQRFDSALNLFTETALFPLPRNSTSYSETPGIGKFRYRVRSANGSGSSKYTVFVAVTITGATSEPTPTATFTPTASPTSTASPTPTATQTATPTPFIVPGDCANSIDDDGDGLSDEDDFDCSGPNQQENVAFSGWTRVRPSSDSRIVYVSSTRGSDSASGLSPNTPKRSLTAAFNLLRSGYPDWMLLERGSTFHEALPHWIKSGRSLTEPMLVGSFGIAGAARPKIVTNGLTHGFDRSGGGGSPVLISNISLIGLEFASENYPGTSGTSGIWWLGGGENFLVEDCYVSGGFGGGITVQSSENAKIKNVKINGSVIVDSYSTNSHAQGIYADYVDGLEITNNFIDHNGYKEGVAPPTIFNHNIYIQYTNWNVTIRNNISSRASAHGTQLRPGGILEDNLYIRNPLGAFVSRGVSHMANNVVLEATDIDSNTPRGYGLTTLQSLGTVVENNIVAHRLATSSWGKGIEASGDKDVTVQGPVTFQNNIVYDWGNNSDAFSLSDPQMRYTKIRVTDNVFQQPNSTGHIVYSESASAFPSIASFSENIYFSGIAASQVFSMGGFLKSFAQWSANYYPDNSTFALLTFLDPDRSVGSYNASLGGIGSFEGFVAAARTASRSDRMTRYSANAVNDYIRAGFVVTRVP